ncbi:hypothetical protein Salat_1864100 [Sesamum alatum]|uniref:Uncharacterized protein n=1 Tax=Sesamum alatum TaxID=300844 RepID=A0AAE1Y2Y8_9LAMI|nr:hypothetical protein Salat_1864100 [Sesamum alatum]
MHKDFLGEKGLSPTSDCGLGLAQQLVGPRDVNSDDNGPKEFPYSEGGPDPQLNKATGRIGVLGVSNLLNDDVVILSPEFSLLSVSHGGNQPSPIVQISSSKQRECTSQNQLDSISMSTTPIVQEGLVDDSGMNKGPLFNPNCSSSGGCGGLYDFGGRG